MTHLFTNLSAVCQIKNQIMQFSWSLQVQFPQIQGPSTSQSDKWTSQKHRQQEELEFVLKFPGQKSKVNMVTD